MKFFKKSDVVIIAVILMASLASFVFYNLYARDESVKAEIYYYSQLIETVSLKGEERTFSIPQDPNVVIRLDGEGNIAFIASDCPDKVCINTGKLHRAGEYAACLPNGIIVKIVPTKRDEDTADIIL